MGESEEIHDFQWLRYFAPEFCVDGNRIEVLETPRSFHSTLKEKAKCARERIVLAALYLGTGSLEDELVQAVTEAAESSKNRLKTDILLDYVRGSRGERNSKTMLAPLIEQYDGSSNLRIALYHTPKLRGTWKKILPPRWNEVIGISHLKVFIFDDTFIISGANLSHDYFVNRQDRYMVFHDCPELADYFHDLVTTVSQFSFALRPDNGIALDPAWSQHPYEGDFASFVRHAHEKVSSLIRRNQVCGGYSPEPLPEFIAQHSGLVGKLFDYSVYMVNYLSSAILTLTGYKELSETEPVNLEKEALKSTDFQRPKPKSHDSAKKNLDTWIYPTIQMGIFGIRQDELVTEQLMKTFPLGSTVSFTTGYFNVTDNYCDLMVRTDTKYKILLASPEANGFYGGQGFSRFIPSVYVHLCKKFYDKACGFGREKDISLWEYIRNGWTFHGKGMWCNLPGESLPSMTLMGSPNFGLRSTDRDLEAQVVLVTNNIKLRKQLHEEQGNMMKHSRRITSDTFRQPRYNVPRWVAFVTYFIKRYF